MSNEKIYSVTEAFSMQPSTWYIGDSSHPSKKKVARIEKEKINFPVNGDPFEYWYYVGYSEEGDKLFQSLCHTVNVTFH